MCHWNTDFNYGLDKPVGAVYTSHLEYRDGVKVHV